MTDLEKRLEEATGPDRELDARIYHFFGYIEIADPKDWLGMTPHGEPVSISPLTASLDAALALVEERLPGWTMICDASAPEAGIDWELFEPKFGGERIKGTAPTHPLALLLALVKAEKQKQEQAA